MPNVVKLKMDQEGIFYDDNVCPKQLEMEHFSQYVKFSIILYQHLYYIFNFGDFVVHIILKLILYILPIVRDITLS